MLSEVKKSQNQARQKNDRLCFIKQADETQFSKAGEGEGHNLEIKPRIAL